MVKTISVPKSFITFNKNTFEKRMTIHVNDKTSIVTDVTDVNQLLDFRQELGRHCFYE